jgi:hypothetical protein
VEGVLRKGIQKERTSRKQFIKFATAVILRDKFKSEKVHEKIQNTEMYRTVYTNTTKNDMNTGKG